MVLRLWRDWCKVWPEQYGHSSLDVKPEGYDPVFDVIPSQAYKDFYVEVVSGHPALRHLNVFEVVDIALNQSRAPEAATVADIAAEKAAEAALRKTPSRTLPARAADLPRVAEVNMLPSNDAAEPDEPQAESA